MQHRKIASFLFSVLLAHLTAAQTLWDTSAPQKLPVVDRWSGIEHAEVRMDAEQLRSALPSAQVKFKSFDLPLPSGKFQSFMIEECTLMDPELQKKYPGIRTFKGTNDQNDRIRLNLDYRGLHAIAFTDEGTVYLDPDSVGGYRSYFASDYKQHFGKSAFENEILPVQKGTKITRFGSMPRQRAARSSGSDLRKYRIAITADYDYTTFHGGTVEGALGAIVTTLNRVTGIYENELAVTFELVADNDRIIITDSLDRQFENLSDVQALSRNQTLIDDRIGNANYDIGHVFSTGASGLATLGVACISGSKARGITGLSPPEGDPFDVDFFAHEIGHQFNATHTWNGVDGQCSSFNRAPESAVEPGSGSTIMAYAGICGDDNLQNNSDPYFHAVSLDQMIGYLENDGGTCPVVSSTGNNPPSIETLDDGLTIPVNTPFKLTATGSDADGDQLTFTWEQLDTGPSGSPDNPTGTAPLFRSISPTTSGVRHFPALSTVLGEGSIKGEVLPTTGRELNFRATARDNNSQGGGTNSTDVSLTVSQTAGPFRVTSQSSSDTIGGGTVILVEWDVARTNESPVNCEFVSIVLSDDNGQNFTQVLVEETLNDGSEYVALGIVPSENARIMVEAVDNVFYNVNTSPFVVETITEPNFDLLISETPGTTCGDTLEFEVEFIAINGFDQSVLLEAFNPSGGATLTFESNLLNPGESTLLRVVRAGEAGTKQLTVSGSANGITQELLFDANFLGAPSTAPVLASPTDRQAATSLRPTFVWSDVDNITGYQFELATDDQFQELVIQELDFDSTRFRVSQELNAKTTYFWRVSGVNACGNGPFSTGTFVTSNLGRTEVSATGLPAAITDLNTTVSTITIDGDIEVADVDVIDLDILHSFVGDLSITLSSPSGTTVGLIERICSGSDSLFLSLDDEALDEDIPCPPATGLAYQPANLLTAFDGESAMGQWTLRITDNFEGDIGSLQGWGLSISSEQDAIWLFAEATGLGRVDLEWTALSANDGYEIEINSGTGDFSPLATTAANVNRFTANNLENSISYEFRVQGIIGDSVSEFSNTSPVTTLPPIPSPPSDLSGSQATGLVLLSWTDNDSIEDGFSIERADGPSASFVEIATTGPDAIGFVDENIELGIDYSYQVRSFNVTGSSDPAGPLVLRVLSADQETRPEEQLYPNPTDGTITIPRQALKKSTHVTVNDVQGKVVMSSLVTDGTSKILGLSHLVSGLYFLQIHSEDELLQVQKFYKR